MQRLTLIAMVLAGLAALCLAAPAYANAQTHLEAPAAQICVDNPGILMETAATPDKPHTLKACMGHKNRLAIPCQTDRCLPVEQMALAFRPSARQVLPLVADALPERDEPDGQFRPPRLTA